MHDVYIYEPDSLNFDGMGLVGALAATACVHDETAGGNSEITLEHPFDGLGKWSFLREGRILKCWVPVRETPLLKMDDGVPAQTITRQVYKVVTEGGRLHLRQKPNTSSKILGRYNPGAEIVKLGEAGTSNGHTWYQVSVVKDGSTGYMAATYLQYARSYTETIEGEAPSVTVGSTDAAGEANWTVRPQLFEIYRRESGDEGIVVNARHISYKLLKNITSYAPKGAVSLQTALNGILDNCRTEHDFKAYTDIPDTREDVSWRLVNPIKAMLDAENGAMVLWNAQLIRDNWNLFFLKRAGGWRGMKIEYGKNLVGVQCSVDISNVATRIIPVGKNKDGTDLFLPEEYIDSPNIGNYSEPLLYPLECSDCKVGSNGLTVDGAYAKMREKANELLTNGCDQPTVSMSVDFLSLGDSEGYAQFREMDKLFLYDEVQIVSLNGYADAVTQVTMLSWDCLHDRALGIGVGSVEASLSSGRLASWQIPSGINGSKLTYGSVGASQLGSDVISARHVQAESINTDALQAKAVTAEKLAAGAVKADNIEAGSITANKIASGAVSADKIAAGAITADKIGAGAITADKLAAGAITADKLDAEAISANAVAAIIAEFQHITAEDITANELYSSFAHIVEIAAGSIAAGTVDADKLAAALAQVVNLQVSTGKFTLAEIKNLLANAFVLEQGIADSIYIKNLAVTAANLLSATLGELVLKGSDGRYYKIVVGSDGTIATERVSVTGDEISAGTTNGGQMIVETTANIADLNATTIKGSQAVLDTILTQSLTAGKITAGQALIASATIPTLYVTSVNALGNSIDFSANKSIRLMVSQRSKVYRQETAPEGALPGDLWIQPSTGYTYQAAGSEDGAPEFYLTDDGYLMYRYADGEAEYPVEIDENGWLVIDSESPFQWTASGDGILTAWSRVKDGDLTSAELSITDTKIALEALKTSYDEQGEHIADLEADLTVQAEKIEGKVSQTIYDEGIATLEASIAEQAGLIESKVSQTVYEAEKANRSKVFRQEHPPQGAKIGDLWIQPSTNYTYQAIGPEDGAPEFYLTDDGYLMYRYADGETEYQLIIDENGWLVIEEDAPFVWASNDDGSLTAWSRVKDGDLTSAETIIRQNTEEIELRVRKATYDLEKVYRSDVAPEDPAKDLMWLDTSLTPPILKKWDGEAWVAVGAQDVKNSSVAINDEQVLIDTGEFILRLHDPDDAENVLMEMSADGNGGFTQLYAQKIYSPSVVSIYEGTSVAVSSAAELEALLQDLRGKYISAPLTISIYGLTSGNFELYGIDGPGDINIVGGVVDASGCTINSLTVTRCRARIDVENVTISTSGTAVSVDASTVRLTGCVINAANGIIANFGATVEAENCTGACTGFLAIPQHGSSMFFTGEIPVGLPDLSGTGNIYTDAVFTAVPAEEEPEELPTITTVTLKPTLTKTFRGSSWRDTYYLWQGRYGSASLSRGCMWFDTSAFAGKTILSATLRLTRMTGSGAGVFVTTNIYGTTAASASGTPAIGTRYASVDLDQGQTRTVDVTNAIAALAAGSIKGLMLYDGSTENLSTASPYTRHYAKYYGYDHSSGPQLTVTYK